jgi:hypothetical protein
MGFEPMPLSLGGRALIRQHTGNKTGQGGGTRIRDLRSPRPALSLLSYTLWRARRGSNPPATGRQPVALSRVRRVQFVWAEGIEPSSSA